jgi:hypothetical protein
MAHETIRPRRSERKWVVLLAVRSKNPSNVQHRCSALKLLGRYSLNQRSPGHVTADQNTTWHTTLRTPNGTIISSPNKFHL